ncbi:MAG TPA: LapA family protein, partial [Ktedonobacterales bacterium]|nr:LapA family protein [Ktedonobacterales bacterium]
MRTLSSLLLGLVAIVLVVALVIFALQNTGPVPLHFLGYGATGSIWWIALGAAALGFVVAYLLMLPGRVAASWRSQGLSRQMQRQDQELATARQQQAEVDAERTRLQQQYEQLQAQHDRLADERGSLV